MSRALTSGRFFWLVLSHRLTIVAQVDEELVKFNDLLCEPFFRRMWQPLVERKMPLDSTSISTGARP